MEFFMAMEDREIQIKLKNLKKEWNRTEERMRKAAIDYEALMAERQSLSSAIAELKEMRAQARCRSSR